MIALLSWLIVAQRVDAVIHAPHLFGLRMPSKVQRITQARGRNCLTAVVAQKRRMVAYFGFVGMQALQGLPTET